MARILVIIPAAGTGSRFGSDIPKQFQPLGGRPILQHVIERFLQHDDVVRIVVPVSQQLLGVVSQNPGERVNFVAGGASRLQSVTKAFRSVGDEFDLVAVHDSVRPFFADATFRNVLAAAEDAGAALPAISVSDTIHAVRDDTIDLTLDRSALVAAQTPQCFRYEVLREVLEKAERDAEEATDEAGLATRYGFPARIIQGDSLNFKITRPEDLALAEAIYAKFAS
jgi:2-C-methyl-D-erythritol 4-phosphate cytidylyltransferase